MTFLKKLKILLNKKQTQKEKREIQEKMKIKKQLDCASSYLQQTVFELPRISMLNMYKTLYIMELVFNMIAQWIVLDEINLNEYEITTKCKQICNFIHTMTKTPEVYTPVFYTFINEKLSNLFLLLTQINNEDFSDKNNEKNKRKER